MPTLRMLLLEGSIGFYGEKLMLKLVLYMALFGSEILKTCHIIRKCISGNGHGELMKLCLFSGLYISLVRFVPDLRIWKNLLAIFISCTWMRALCIHDLIGDDFSLALHINWFQRVKFHYTKWFPLSRVSVKSASYCFIVHRLYC